MNVCRALTGAPPDLTYEGWIEAVRAGLPAATEPEARIALTTTLAVLGDTLPAAVLLSFTESMPEACRMLLVRNWNGPDDAHSVGSQSSSIVTRVADHLPPNFSHHACLAVRVVFGVLCRRLDQRLVMSISGALPERTRRLWPPTISCQIDGGQAGAESRDMPLAS